LNKAILYQIIKSMTKFTRA